MEKKLYNLANIFKFISKLKEKIEASKQALEKQKTNFINKEEILPGGKKLTVISELSCFIEKVNMELENSRKNSKGLAILFIDTDNFNSKDDILSFDYKDKFLKLVSRKIESYIIGSKCALYMLSENKLLLSVYNIDSIDEFKNDLEKALNQLTEYNTSDIYDNINVGISIYSEHGYSTNELIDNAKVAMYKAKELGKNKHSFFEENLYKEMIEKKEMENHLRNAIKHNELFIHYQPQIDIKTNKIYGVEALLRWNSHKHGYMSPNKFIPLAEETGLIIEIGEWILREACIQSKKWQEVGLNIKTSINISAAQLQDNDFLNKVKNIFSETNVNTSLIGFEITESILIESTKEAQKVLKELKNIGVKISLDDFGTGYSSLTYLDIFPIDTIKIDKSFMDDLFTSPTKSAIIESIVYLAQNIGMDVTAEGIEHIEELEFLKEKNCDKVQGYLFSKPLPINEIEMFFSEFTKKVI